jgi:uncharacterized protein YjbI with pentapeptide repeats
MTEENKVCQELTCGRPLYDNKHCIFHSEDKSKGREFIKEFWKEYESQIKTKDSFNFRGFVFPRVFDFMEKEFKKGVSFIKSKFLGDTKFSKVSFLGDVLFSGARFSGGDLFRYTKFAGLAFFDFASFSGAVLFDSATFSGTTSFDSATFSGYADFKDANFSGNADFMNAQFSYEADFTNAQFSGEADFLGAKFNRNGKFNGASFFQKANFSRVEFYAGNDNLDGAIDGSITPVTKISVKRSAENYSVGMKIKVGINDNFGRGFEITTIDVLNKTLTISPGVNDVQLDDAQVRGLIPASENSTANFSHTKFSKFADFGEAQFGGETYFTGAEFFDNASFNQFNFHGKATFREVKFNKRAEFQNIIADEDVNNLSFEYTYIFNEKGLFDFIKNNKDKFSYSKKSKLKFLPDNFKLILGEEVTVRDPTTTRKVRDDMFLLKFKDEHPNWFKIWWLFADCGRSFFRWAWWSLIFAAFFAAIFYLYFLESPSSFQTVYVSEGCPFFSFFYYSVVTFTTLGFGDIVPKCGWLQMWVMFEVILGYIMMGGLISILANKLARRS